MKLNRDKQRWTRYLSPLALGLLMSFVVHTVFIAYQLRRDQDTAAAPNPPPIEIAELPPEYRQPPRPAQKKPPQPPAPSKEQQMAETEDANNRDVDDKAKFLSEHNQKAEKQSKAKQVDDFRKKSGTGLKNENKQSVAQNPPTLGENGEKTDDDSPGVGETRKKPGEEGVKRDWKTLSLKDLSMGGDGGATAASDDKLDNVDRGERTILSTREYKFFSYYQRIKELLRQYWKPNIERKLAKLYRVGKSVQENELVTKVLVLLDEKGGIQKISRVSGSGIVDVDEAAMEAFQKAGPFPNPPKGMMDADGFVRIRWDFILTVEAAPRIQFSSAGQGGKNPAY